MKAPSTGNTAGGTLPAKAELDAQAASEQILHYEVRGKLGEGGMGVVYKAVDRKLNRLVALKFLPPHIDPSDVSLERFLQEANALSALNHPHIATIYTLEADGERQFLVLEYLPGGTLKAKLQQARNSGTSLSTEDILKYAQQTAEGLAYAHARGIIHRDVKTSNLMLTEEGDVKVTDFGVAKLTGSSLRTLPGSLVGTIAYMSPEQVLGMEVDARSDAFSFGVALFELISGRLPFEAPNDAALLTKIANARVPQLKELRPDVPPELERIVGRALKKRREERYPSMGEVLADIRALREGRPTQTRLGTRIQVPAGLGLRKPRRFVALVVATVFALIVVALLIRRAEEERRRAEEWSRTQPPATSTKPAASRLAIVPFRFVGPGQRNEELAGEVSSVLSNDLIQLEQFQGLLSVSSAADAVKERVTNAKEAIARFRANLVLTGVVVEENDRFIVTADLFEAQKQIVVNSTDVEGKIDQLPALRESLLQRVAEILQTQLGKANEARGLCQQARGYLSRYDRTQNLEIAITLFEKALQQAPSYAPAHAGRAEAYLRTYELTADSLSLERARDGVLAAMHLNAQLAPVNFAMGLYRHATGDYEGAVASFQRSLEIQPGPDAARELGNSYNALNRLAEAEAAYARAIQMRRGYWAGYKDLAVFYNKHGRFKESCDLLERVAQLAPDDYSSYTNLGALYVKRGMFAEGAEVFRQAVSIDPSSMAYYQLGTALYLGHRYPEAVETYQKAIALNPTAVNWGALGKAAHFVPGIADIEAKAFKNAVALAAEQLKIRPRDAQLRAEIASWLVYTDKGAALRELRTALRLNPQDGRVQSLAGVVYEMSGLRSKALAAIEAAVKLGSPLEEMERWPTLEKLRQDPRYKRIVEMSTKGGIVKPK